MSLFENFPYTNLHELNLDWLIQQMKELEEKVHDGPVVSVNGLTGEVVLYREAHIQLPDIADPTITTWDVFRYLNGNIYGIQFDNNGNVYALKDSVRTKLLTWADIPADAGVISVNGLYGVVHLSGTDIPYMGGETETVYDKLSDLDDDITSAQADINDLTVTMGTIDNAIKRGIAYLESTDTAVNNIPAGRYVFWKNYAYISTSAISAGDALSSTNLSAVATGGFINALKNELQTEINTLNSNINHFDASKTAYVADQNPDDYTVSGSYHIGIASAYSYTGSVIYGILNVYAGNSGFIRQEFLRTTGEMVMRTKANTNDPWSAWMSVLSTHGTYLGNQNANNYTDNGIYYLGITTNSPLGATTAYCILLVMKLTNNFITQIAITTTNKMCFRAYNSDIWGAWREVSVA